MHQFQDEGLNYLVFLHIDKPYPLDGMKVISVNAIIMQGDERPHNLVP